MPRRNLPNTDKCRYQTLKQCLDQLTDTNPNERFVSQDQFESLQSVMSRFEQIFLAREKLKADPEYLAVQEKAGMFLKHYLLVMQMAVMRGEMPEKNLAYYGIKSANATLPAMNTAKQILEWGPKIFDADAQRIANGGKYITNPSIAVVKVWFEKFKDVHQNHKVQIEKFRNNKEFLSKLRSEATQKIIEFWNLLEYEYQHLESEEIRDIAKTYGLSYSLSSSEIAQENSPKTARLFNPEEIPVEKSTDVLHSERPKKIKRRKSISNPDLQASFAFLLEEINANEQE